MKTRLALAGAILLSFGTPTFAHRLNEYLQATTLSIEKDRVQAQISLTPGVAVFPIVLAKIDTDADGVISQAEQQAYAERVLRDLSLTIDGDRLRLRLVSSRFATIEEMKEGRGDIRLKFNADLPRSDRNRRLIFENHHLRPIAAYLVNCLVPRDPDIQITAQHRNYEQSLYELDYVQAGVGSSPLPFVWWSRAQGWLGTAALLLVAPLALLWRQRTRAENDATSQQ
jgi:Tfp pilus assembly protein FimT